ncbi:unnamed protein product [Echinostoma caproni]|uniref:DUF551 domain-containing protein n=1 Tax=Echinostoma caproni TaxID=27848 RepID=A0A183AW13_9TREM|nr:unnamed protein product [Echinostoma caproni]
MSSTPTGSAPVLRKQTLKIATPTDLIEIARQIQECEQYVSANTCSRLHMIVKQMKNLKKEAEQILKNCQRDIEVHKLPCNFVKKPGNTYYVYQRSDGTKYLGLLSPEEWGPSCPSAFLGAYKLMPDMTWVPETELQDWNKTEEVVKHILSTPSFLAIDSKESV